MACLVPDTAQDIIRCDVCPDIDPNNISRAEVFCNSCRFKLCGSCVPKHISADNTTKHDIVLFTSHCIKPGLVLPDCTSHSSQKCDLFCKQCDVPVCIKCLTTCHNMHNVSDLKELCQMKKDKIKQDKEELETQFVPKIEQIRTELADRKKRISEEYHTLNNAIDERASELLDTDMIRIGLARVKEMYKQNLAKVEERYSTEIGNNTTEIEGLLTDAKQTIKIKVAILRNNNAMELINYQSKEMKNVPSTTDLSFPKFIPSNISDEHMSLLFGKLELPATCVENDSKEIKNLNQQNKSPLTEQPFLQDPQIILCIKQEYDHLYDVTVINSNELWISGETEGNQSSNRIDMNGLSMEEIKKPVYSIGISEEKELVYSDRHNLYVMRNGNSKRLVRIWGWSVEAFCFVGSTQMLVCFVSVNRRKCKIVRYQSLKSIQEIQFDDVGNPLYAANDDSVYYIDVNRNGDICVTDSNSLVVVSQTGKFKFRYDGNEESFTEIFQPLGVTTDSMSHILIADSNNECIVLLDQNGSFIRYFTCNNALNGPRCLSIDSQGLLCLAEEKTSKIKFIKYLK